MWLRDYGAIIVPHLPKIEFPHSIKLYSNVDGVIETAPKEVTNVKVERTARQAKEVDMSVLISGATIFVDSKWSKGADLNKDFTLQSKVYFNGDTFTIEHVEYVTIMGEFHHVEVVLT